MDRHRNPPCHRARAQKPSHFSEGEASYGVARSSTRRVFGWRQSFPDCAAARLHPGYGNYAPCECAHCTMPDAFMAPAWRATSRPPRNNASVGMLRMS